MTIPYLRIVVVGVFAIVFYRAGRYERSSGLVWAAASAGASLAVLVWLRGGLWGVVIAQALVFVVITLYRMGRRG
jgi:hypothetical protein